VNFQTKKNGYVNYDVMENGDITFQFKELIT